MALLRRDGAVFVVTLDSHEGRLNGPSLAALHAALDEIEAHDGDAALVTLGEGRFYSNGMDIEWFEHADADEAAGTMPSFHRLLARILTFPMITVAALNGHAFGGGALLALAHDYRVMRADRGYWCMPEVDLATGLPMTPGMTALLRARLAPAVFHEAVVTGRRFAADAAVEHRVVDRIGPAEQVLPGALEIARTLATKHRPTVGALKRGMYEWVVDALDRSDGGRSE